MTDKESERKFNKLMLKKLLKKQIIIIVAAKTVKKTAYIFVTGWTELWLIVKANNTKLKRFGIMKKYCKLAFLNNFISFKWVCVN